LESVSELVAAPVDKQDEWLQQQPWFVDENFELEILEAPSFVDVFPWVKEGFDDLDAETAAHYLYKVISTERLIQIEDGAKLLSSEKQTILDALVDQDYEGYSFYEAHAKEFDFLGERLQAVFYGLNHPQGGFGHEFLGIFRSLEDAKVALESKGYVTDKFVD